MVPFRSLSRLIWSDDGTTSWEYASMVALIVVFALAAITALYSRPPDQEPAAAAAEGFPEDLGDGALFFREAHVISPRPEIDQYLRVHPEMERTGEMWSGTLIRVKREPEKPDPAP